jgi:cytochrome c
MSKSVNPLATTGFLLAGALLASTLIADAAQGYGFGTPATPTEISRWSDDVRGDGKGLPPGHGTVAEGGKLYAAQCASCHGDFGEGAGRYPALAGGNGSLKADRPVQTVGSYWPYAPTLYDYIRRAMPFPAPGTLTADQTYAITAYVLNLNNLLPESTDLDAAKLAAIKMPNRDGFFDAHLKADFHATRCMKDCKPGPPPITSDLARTIGVTPSLTNDATTLDVDEAPTGATSADPTKASAATTTGTSSVATKTVAVAPVVTFAQIAPIVAQRCATCHAAKPTQAGFTAAPMGIVLDTPAKIHGLAAQIKAQAVSSHQMPIGNVTKMTDAERVLLGKWIAAGAAIP